LLRYAHNDDNLEKGLYLGGLCDLCGRKIIMKTFLNTLILITIFFTGKAYALTMDEAVKLALEKNNKIKEYAHKEKSQRYQVKASKSEFLPNLDLSYSYTKLDEASAYQDKESSVASIEASYNLFNGFIDSNKVDEAKSLLHAYEFERKAVEADIIYTVKIAYIEVLRARKGLQVESETVELLKKEKKDAELFYREGITAKNELLKVEVELASAKQKYLLSKSRLVTAIDRLNRFTGAALSDETDIADLAAETSAEKNYRAIRGQIPEERSELKYLQALRKSKEYNLKTIKGEYLPTVDFSLSQSSFGDSTSPSGRSGDDAETRAMLTAKWELADRVKKNHSADSMTAQIASISARIEDLKDELKLQLSSAIEEHGLARGRIEVAKKGVEQANENYRITSNQFRQQVATSTDLLDAGIALARAKNDYNNATYDLHEAIAKIERVEESY